MLCAGRPLNRGAGVGAGVHQPAAFGHQQFESVGWWRGGLLVLDHERCHGGARGGQVGVRWGEWLLVENH